MDGDCLKLTSYVSERHRAGGQPTADALLDLYRQHEIAASILLRGMPGFGLRHHLRTDRSLTLPEDLRLVAVAVDARPRIEAVLEQAIALAGPGLVTLERAQLLDGNASQAFGPAGPGEDAAKLTIFLGRHEQAYHIPAFEAVCDLLYRRGVAGATALLGVDGTARGQRQRARFMGRHEMPMMVIAVGSQEQVSQVIPDVSGLLRHPLLTLEPVRVCKRDGLLLGVPDRSSGTGELGLPLWQKLTVYTSGAARHDGQPIHRVLTQRLRAAGLGGVTTLRGMWGFRGDHTPHGGSGLRLAHHVPAMTIVIDAPKRIATAFGIIDELTGERGLVTSETVPATRAATSNLRQDQA